MNVLTFSLFGKTNTILHMVEVNYYSILFETTFNKSAVYSILNIFIIIVNFFSTIILFLTVFNNFGSI